MTEVRVFALELLYISGLSSRVRYSSVDHSQDFAQPAFSVVSAKIHLVTLDLCPIVETHDCQPSIFGYSSSLFLTLLLGTVFVCS